MPTFGGGGNVDSPFLVVRVGDDPDLNAERRLTAGTNITFVDSGPNGTLTINAAASITDHGGLTGKGDDDHLQYVLLAGRAGGQVIVGGTASGENLGLSSTSHGTKGEITLDSTLSRVGDNIFILLSNRTVATGIAGAGFRLDHQGVDWSTPANPERNVRQVSIGGGDGVGGYVEKAYFGGVATSGTFLYGLSFPDNDGNIAGVNNIYGLANTSSSRLTLGAGSASLLATAGTNGNIFIKTGIFSQSVILVATSFDQYWNKKPGFAVGENKNIILGMGADAVRGIPSAHITGDDVVVTRFVDADNAKNLAGTALHVKIDVINPTGSQATSYIKCTDVQAAVVPFEVKSDYSTNMLGDLVHTGSNIGVFSTAAVAKQTVTGSRAGNAALASALTALAAYGLVLDSSTA